MIETTLESTPRPARGSEIARDLALAVASAAVFGAAAGTGHGALAVFHGAWSAPALFAGGATLATPPLYLATALGGGRLSAHELAASAARSLAAASTVLLGLAAPAAFFSATLRTSSAAPLVVSVAAVVGAGGVLALAHHATVRATRAPAVAATLAWAGFAVLLGVRLIGTVGRASGLFGGGS